MSDSSGGSGPEGSGQEPEVGSVAEEAAKLVGALSDWAREQGSETASGLGASIAGLADVARDVEAHVGGENCTYCPLCRLIGAVRATSPEVKGHLATAATSLIQAAAGALATQVPPDAQRRTGSVQRIDLDEEQGGPHTGEWD